MGAAKVVVQPLDVRNKQELQQFAEAVNTNLGPVDVLVNNAGIYTPGQVHSEEEHVLEELMETNLYSAYHLTRLLLPPMMEQRQGHIFNMCSTASITSYPNGGSYCITKHALYGMSKVLREEMKPFNVRVTSILPGATWTDSWAGSPLPESRFMDARAVAEAVFCCWQMPPGAVVEDLVIRPMQGDIDEE